MNYKKKYIKYKNKYIDLMTKIGGSSANKGEIMNYYKQQIIKSSNYKKGYKDYIIKSFKKTDDDGNSIATQNPINMMYCESWLHFIASILVWVLSSIGINYFNKSLDNIILIMDNSKIFSVYNDSSFFEKSKTEQLIIDYGERPVSDHYLIKSYIILEDYKNKTFLKLGSLNLEGMCSKYNLEYEERKNELINLLNKASIDIICFQETSLKDDEIEGWSDRKKNIEVIKNILPTFTLIGDDYTSMIGYDKYTWKLNEYIEIPRMGTGKKKSNAYKLEYIKNNVEIIVVNIHLKAGMMENNSRIDELRYIYNKTKEFSQNFKIPVVLIGDFNDDLKNIEYIIKGFK